MHNSFHDWLLILNFIWAHLVIDDFAGKFILVGFRYPFFYVMADAEFERQVRVLISVYIDVCLQVS